MPTTTPDDQAAQEPTQADTPLLQRVAEALLNEHQPGLYSLCTATTCRGGVWPCAFAELAGEALGRTLPPPQRPTMKESTR